MKADDAVSGPGEVKWLQVSRGHVAPQSEHQVVQQQRGQEHVSPESPSVMRWRKHKFFCNDECNPKSYIEYSADTNELGDNDDGTRSSCLRS